MCKNAEECQGTCEKAQAFNFIPPDEPCKEEAIPHFSLLDLIREPHSIFPEVTRAVHYAENSA